MGKAEGDELMAGRGQPTKYREKYCQTAVEFLKEGYSVTALAGHIGVARSTIFKWADDYPEFGDALRTGQALAAMWWEERLRDIVRGGEGNATAAIFGVKNRSSKEWRDKTEQEVSGGITVTVKPEHDDI